MKTKKILTVLLITLIMPLLIGCDIVWNLDNVNQITTNSQVTLPELIDGQITFTPDDYSSFPTYEASIYQSDDVDAFYDQLLLTQTTIRHSNIEIYNHLYETTTNPFFPDKTSEVGLSSGSGFVFMEDETYYYAITNFHVIDSEGYDQEIEIMAYGDADFYPAELIAYDQDIDLAVLKFQKYAREDVVILDIYSRLFYQFDQGEAVLAVGNPQDVYNIVTVGEFKSLESIQNVEYNVIYHNAQIDEGSSGGALVDIDGYLLGVNTWGLDETEIYSFSIPNYIVYMFLVNYGIIEPLV